MASFNESPAWSGARRAMDVLAISGVKFTWVQSAVSHKNCWNNAQLNAQHWDLQSNTFIRNKDSHRGETHANQLHEAAADTCLPNRTSNVYMDNPLPPHALSCLPQAAS